MEDEPLRRQEREERLLKKKQMLHFDLGVLRGFAVFFFSNLLVSRPQHFRGEFVQLHHPRLLAAH
jgi:hypothetical protein